MGLTLHPAYEPKLKGIKALEKNESVLGQVWMWATQLQSRPRDLFSEEDFVSFGHLLSFECDIGIDDAVWLRSEETAGPEDSEEERDDLGLPLFASVDDP